MTDDTDATTADHKRPEDSEEAQEALEQATEACEETILQGKAKAAELSERIDRLQKASAAPKPKVPGIGAMF